MKKFVVYFLILIFSICIGISNTWAKPLDKASPLARGTKHFRNENYQKAINNFKKAVENNPNDAMVYYNLGVAYIKTNQLQNAKSNIKKANELFKTNNNDKGVKATNQILQKLNSK